jgi:LacI family transcriptional regulator
MPPPETTTRSNDRTVDLAYDPGNPAARAVIAGVVQGLRERGGWTCRLAATDHGPHAPRSVADMVLTCEVGDGTRTPILPLVRLTPRASRHDAATIVMDRAVVVRLAIDHLAAAGVETFAFATTRPIPDAKEWAADYRTSVDGSSANQVWLPAELGGRSGRTLIEWLGGLPTLTGIIAPTDIDGALLVDACRKAGLRVAADVAVVGVGNDELLCEITDPTLSSIDLGLGRLGQEAARILAAMPTHSNRSFATQKIVLPPIRVVDRESTDTFETGDAVVAAALRIMRGKIADAPSPQQLARMVGLSRASLERRMRAAIGRSIHGELLRLRIAAASRLLIETDQPIRDVAAAAGFGSVQYMTTVVKRHFGLTPAQLRGTADRRRG